MHAPLEAAIPGEPARGQRPFASAIENVLERYGVDDVETIFRALVANRAVHVPGFGNDEMVERLQRAWDVEPGYSKTPICLLEGCKHPRQQSCRASRGRTPYTLLRGSCRSTHSPRLWNPSWPLDRECHRTPAPKRAPRPDLRLGRETVVYVLWGVAPSSAGIGAMRHCGRRR